MKSGDIDKVKDILKEYKGTNNLIHYYKHLFERNTFEYDDFAVEYVLSNHDYEEKTVNKVVKITSYVGEKLQKKHFIDFCPEKILITRIIGEIGNSYHCYIQYRQSVPPVLTFINKNGILNEIETVDWGNINVNFSKYDKKSGRKLKNHQKEGVKFLVGNKKCILADTMGFGKSTTSVVAALETKVKNVLILCPASLKTNWKREISFYDKEENISIVNGSEWKVGKRWTIVNYDILHNFYKIPFDPVFDIQTTIGEDGRKHTERIPVMVKDKKTGEMVQKLKKSTRKDAVETCLKESMMAQTDFDCVIIDEAHKLSNNSSLRYKILDDFLKKRKPTYCFMLTGTPVVNKPINLYYILKLLDANVTKDYVYYTKRYCAARTINLKSGQQVTLTKGASNLDELKEKIKNIYIRREIADLDDMVNKQVITKYYDLTEEQETRYRQLWEEYVEAQLEQGNENSEEYRQLVEGMIVRQYLAQQMIPHTIEIANEKIEDGDKVIIVCTFEDEINKFKKYYKDKAVVFDGKTSLKNKDKAVSEFMNNPKVQVFIGQIESAGTGLTLTVSNLVIFNSYSWIAASNKQMEDRIYRLTQDRDVTCIYQVFNDDISRHMFETVQGKQFISDSIIKKENEK